MGSQQRIALLAHDQRKQDPLEWVLIQKEKLKLHDQCATGTTGGLIDDYSALAENRLKSGPLGGDQQLGAMIAGN